VWILQSKQLFCDNIFFVLSIQVEYDRQRYFRHGKVNRVSRNSAKLGGKWVNIWWGDPAVEEAAHREEVVNGRAHQRSLIFVRGSQNEVETH
jgi:hypothetical protein